MAKHQGPTDYSESKDYTPKHAPAPWDEKDWQNYSANTSATTKLPKVDPSPRNS